MPLGRRWLRSWPHAAAAFHQLHLLFVDFQDGTIAVGGAVEANDEAVAQRGGLEVVANAGHGRALGHEVAEVAEQFKDLVFAQRVGIFGFDASKFGRPGDGAYRRG